MRIVCGLIIALLWLSGKAQNTCAERLAKYGFNIDSVQNPVLFYTTCDWLGTRYRYAGNSKKGIDCSGFSQVLYKEAFCIEMGGGSRDMWTLVTPVSKDSLQEGDLLFFKIKKGRISHVGVYLGKQKMAHASVKSGVIISDLGEPYYKKYYFSGGRLRPGYGKH